MKEFIEWLPYQTALAYKIGLINDALINQSGPTIRGSSFSIYKNDKALNFIFKPYNSLSILILNTLFGHLVELTAAISFVAINVKQELNSNETSASKLASVIISNVLKALVYVVAAQVLKVTNIIGTICSAPLKAKEYLCGDNDNTDVQEHNDKKVHPYAYS
ncbi:MAG: hypothetical protein P1U74_10675 [Legionellaceae bacterium]|nr:hypothetical protein [Legionellaceae bacterium]